MRKCFDVTAQKTARRIAAFLFCCLLFDEQSIAQLRGCSQKTINRLETESDTIRSWSQLRSFYHLYNRCKIDDAEVSQGTTESVVRLLADHWETLPTASKLFRLDPSFKQFALAGINVTALTADLDHIDKLAVSECPKDLRAVCGDIRRSIRENK